MAYRNAKGKMQFSMKEKYSYHKECADSGKKPDGTKLTMTQRVHSANLAEKYRRRLGTFKGCAEVANAACPSKKCSGK